MVKKVPTVTHTPAGDQFWKTKVQRPSVTMEEVFDKLSIVEKKLDALLQQTGVDYQEQSNQESGGWVNNRGNDL
jgi:hypothetical protein